MAERRCPVCGRSKAQIARDVDADLGGGDGLDDAMLEVIARDAPVLRPMAPDRDAADRVASLVASWAFPLTVLALIVVWLAVNLTLRPFEPFPVVFLAVVSATLASLGALQGPIILRVQRRQRQRDHERDEIDHRVNLRAEVEIRWLDHKLDHLLERTAEPRTTDRHDAPAPRKP